MSNMKKRKIVIIFALCLLTCMLCGFTTVSPPLQDDAQISPCTDVLVAVNGLPVSRAYKIDDTTFMSLPAFCEALGFQPEDEWDEETLEYHLWFDGMHMEYTAGNSYMMANDRCIYLDSGVYKLGDSLIFPIRSLATAFNVDVAWVDDKIGDCVNLDTDELSLMVSGEKFYNEEDLYWLSRIIQAEAGNQSIEGKIGVGNVVLNRVEDPSCPDSVYEVIFDNRYGVQFSPTETGTIYCEPSDESVAAAKLCLEGYDTVGASLFFLNPDSGASDWFSSTRTYVVTIGNHDFYA